MNSISRGKDFNNPNYWDWNGIKVCWSVMGENNKFPIIFLHGFGASSMHWRSNLDYFAKRNFAAYSIDLIGFGNSDQPGIKEFGKLDNGVWCNQVKDFINDVVKPMHPRKVILIGNSLGALVALTCAVFLEDDIATVIASPLPDQIIRNESRKVLNQFFKKLKNKLIKLFFIISPLEIILFLINNLGIIEKGLNSAYFKKDYIDDELIEIVRKPALRNTAARSLRAMCIGMSTREEKLKASFLLKIA